MLRGASAEALSALLGSLGRTSPLSDAETLGDELFAVAGALRSEPALRRAVTDASLEQDAREGLVRSVLGTQVGERTLDLVADAVRRRWVSPRDLLEALDHLAVTALVNSAGDQASRVGDELFAVVQTVDGSPELRDSLSDPGRSVADRTGLIGGLLQGKVLPATQRLVEHAVTASATGSGSVDRVLADYQTVAAQAQDERVAVVRTARELPAADLERLSVALGKQYSSTIHLHVVVEPDLVGGLRIEVGDDVIDGTVSSRLDDARRRLVG